MSIHSSENIQDKILRYLSKNGPQSADTIAGHVMAANRVSNQRVAAILTKMHKEGLVRPLESWWPRKWAVNNSFAPAKNIVSFPLNTLRKAA